MMRAALTPFSFAPPPVAALAPEARVQLKAARMWVMLARHQRNPRPVLEALLGGATAGFCSLMETLVTAWPDAFTCFPPCASQLAPDEAAFIALMEAAGESRAADAMAMLEDMLPASDRERIWRAAVRAC